MTAFWPSFLVVLAVIKFVSDPGLEGCTVAGLRVSWRPFDFSSELAVCRWRRRLQRNCSVRRQVRTVDGALGVVVAPSHISRTLHHAIPIRARSSNAVGH